LTPDDLHHPLRRLPITPLPTNLAQILHLQLRAPHLGKTRQSSIVLIGDGLTSAEVDLGKGDPSWSLVGLEETIAEVGGEAEVEGLVCWRRGGESVGGKKTAEEADGYLREGRKVERYNEWSAETGKKGRKIV
jgi:hypothetical protein